MKQRLGMLVATCGYVGFAPVAPGTFGSAVGLLLWWAERSAGIGVFEAAVVAVTFVVGVWSATIAEGELGVDPGPVVIDEVLGMFVTLAFLPVNTGGAIVGFLVFRVLDVVKPWPSGRFERLPGGLGVMADDAMAGVYGNLVMRGLIAALPIGWLA